MPHAANIGIYATERGTQMPEQEANETKTDKEAEPVVSWQNFLETHPPRKAIHVTGLITTQNPRNAELATPDLTLYCDDAYCEGMRAFEFKDGNHYISSKKNYTDAFLVYRCKNCEKTLKHFAIYYFPTKSNGWFTGTGNAYKFGELPPFGPRVPSRVFKLIGEENRELFLLGRRAESQGMGIGAFTYYRRVVVNQKNRILEEVIKVGEKTNAEQHIIDVLKNAQEEQQFTKAMELVKDAIPPVLLVDGHNPLALLHSSLSIGLHGQTDKECLELATNIREVLAALAERAAQALKDEAGLKKAISRLIQSKSAKKQPGKSKSSSSNSKQ